jgi:hypothetical protein
MVYLASSEEGKRGLSVFTNDNVERKQKHKRNGK